MGRASGVAVSALPRPLRDYSIFADLPGIRAVLVLDDGVYIVRTDGTLEPVLPGGRPGGMCAHSTARPKP
jgi:hypothetical protein